VANGIEAVEMLEKMDFDVIVSDVKMPGMGGMDLGKWISENKPDCMERFVLITGAIDAEIEKFSMDYGCHHMTKPFKVEEIMKKVAIIVKKSGRI
jgi:YesN/AraC family two-component response regulator